MTTGSPPGPIRLVVVDDHALVREGTAQLLDQDPGIAVVGQAASAEESMGLVEEVRPDVALVDVNLPGRSGLEFARWASVHQPELRVLILSAYDDREFVDEAIDAGVGGYMLKTASTSELLKAIRAVADGIFVLDGALSRRLARHGPTRPSGPAGSLTQRESEVLQLLVEGMSNKQIAARLGLGVRTVEGYVSSVLGKLGAASRTEAVLLALQLQLLIPERHG